MVRSTTDNRWLERTIFGWLRPIGLAGFARPSAPLGRLRAILLVGASTPPFTKEGTSLATFRQQTLSLVIEVMREPHVLWENLGSVDRRIRTKSSTSDQSCMSFLRNPTDRCLRSDGSGRLFCSCFMVSRCSDVRSRMDLSVCWSCIRTQDAGVLPRLEIPSRRPSLVDE